jgi:AbrB family looped-hinge helix DNA binding protein
MDQAGRVVLPKALREDLGLRPGDTLNIETEGDRIILSPVRNQAGLQKELGVWVYRSGTPAHDSIPDLIEQQRRRRTEGLMHRQP